MDFAPIIKGISANLLIIQTELADILGVSLATINHRENGHSEPTMKQKQELIVFWQIKRIQHDNLGE